MDKDDGEGRGAQASGWRAKELGAILWLLVPH